MKHTCEAVTLLKKLEWVEIPSQYEGYGPWWGCPECRGTKPYKHYACEDIIGGHVPGCKLAELIDAPKYYKPTMGTL